MTIKAKEKPWYSVGARNYIGFVEDVTLPSGTTVYLGRDNSGDLTVNVLTGKEFHAALNGTDAFSVGTTVDVHGRNIEVTGNGSGNKGLIVEPSATNYNFGWQTGISLDITTRSNVPIHFYQNGGLAWKIDTNKDLLATGNRTIKATSAQGTSISGTTATLAFDIPVGTGGTANNIVAHDFQIASATTFLVMARTDGTGSVTQRMIKLPQNNTALPTAAFNWRGNVAVRLGGATGTGADDLLCCLADGTGGYNWIQVATG